MTCYFFTDMKFEHIPLLIFHINRKAAASGTCRNVCCRTKKYIWNLHPELSWRCWGAWTICFLVGYVSCSESIAFHSAAFSKIQNWLQVATTSPCLYGRTISVNIWSWWSWENKEMAPMWDISQQTFHLQSLMQSYIGTTLAQASPSDHMTVRWENGL